MSQRRRPKSRQPILHRPRVQLPKLSRLQVIGFLAICGVLYWLIATTTLVDALATSNPDLALRLNPKNPQALISKAENLRRRWLDEVTSSPTTNQTPSSLPEPLTSTAPPPALAPLPGEASVASSDGADREHLRQQIRSLALRALESDRLNATAYRLLGETSDDIATTREMMKAAVVRARRESVAVFWLLNDAVQQKNSTEIIRYSEILLRTRPELTRYVHGVLGSLGTDVKSRPELVEWLAVDRNAKLRDRFLINIPAWVQDARTPMDVIQDLSKRGLSPSSEQLYPYLNLLVQKDLVEFAYYSWLQHLGPERMSRVGNVYNAGFEEDTSGLPFDWQIAPTRNATVEIRRRDDDPGRALYLRFGGGSASVKGLSQTLLVGPGSYSLTFDYKIDIVAKRGLRWRLTCLYGKRQVLHESEMLSGRSREWKTLSATFEIPASPDCRAQTLSLVHDSRSASEQLISGDAWFDNLGLKVTQVTAPPAAN